MKYQIPPERLQVDNIPNQAVVPDKTIAVIANNEQLNPAALGMIENLKDRPKRDWLSQHAYFCLPLKIGNQHGFIVKALYDVDLFWDGGETPRGVQVRHKAQPPLSNDQNFSSHFGLGIVTVQNCFAFRTPPGVNLLVMNPPNFYLDGLVHLTAVVEADNLRRDFTFNLKLTRPHHWVTIPAGSPVGCILPYPRHFIDHYEVKPAESLWEKTVIEAERETMRNFGRERAEIDSKYPGANGFRYLNGEDVYSNKFDDHQKKLP